MREGGGGGGGIGRDNEITISETGHRPRSETKPRYRTERTEHSNNPRFVETLSYRPEQGH